MRTTLKQAIAVLALSAAAAFAPAHAAITYLTGPNSLSIPGLTAFATTGSMMDGLSVTATFSGGLTQTRAWADTGLTSGGVTGSGWSLSLDGDTFIAPWNFTNNPNSNLGQLVSLVLDGRNALTIFDRTLPSLGTDGSAAGQDWLCLSGSLCDTATVTYDYIVGIGAAAAVGDLFQLVTINFGTGGPRVDFSFTQDTDNDSRLTVNVPEPGSLMLIGAALAIAGLSRRRSA